MKVIISSFLLCVCISGYANSSVEKPLKVKATINKTKKDKSACSVSCSMSIDNGMGGSTTVSASAGSIFTSCSTAQSNCHRKLMHELVDMLF